MRRCPGEIDDTYTARKGSKGMHKGGLEKVLLLDFLTFMNVFGFIMV